MQHVNLCNALGTDPICDLGQLQPARTPTSASRGSNPSLTPSRAWIRWWCNRALFSFSSFIEFVCLKLCIIYIFMYVEPPPPHYAPARQLLPANYVCGLSSSMMSSCRLFIVVALLCNLHIVGSTVHMKLWTVVCLSVNYDLTAFNYDWA